MRRQYDSLADADRLAKAAQDRMRALDIPSHPINFAVWYEYVSARHPGLKRMIDSLLAQRVKFNERINTELFEQAFSIDTQSSEVSDWCARVEKVAEQIILAVDQGNKDAKDYSATLRNASGLLGSQRSDDSVRKIVDKLVEETRVMEKRIVGMQTLVSASRSEITELKDQLDSARHTAQTDALTGLANRRGFDATFAAAIETARRDSTRLSLLLLDLDYFKKFNDTHGHQYGDQVLRLVGQTLMKCIKGQDLAARYGGEEFAIILPVTPIDGAMTVGENIRTAVASKKVVNRESGVDLGTITVSVGAAEYASGESGHELVARADRALYLAKSSGRNRVNFIAATIDGAARGR